MNKLIKDFLFLIGSVLKKKRQMPTEIGRILCILPHYLGDTLWMLNAVKLLQKYFPQAEIDVVLRRDFSALLTGIVDKEHILVEPSLVSDRKREKVSLVKICQTAKKYRKKYDVVADLGGNRYSALFAHWCRAKFVSGFNGDEFGFLYDVRTPDELHENKYLGLRASLSVIYNFDLPQDEYEKIVVEQPITENYAEFYRQKYNLPQSELVLLAPCAGWKEKEWGDDKFRALAELLINDGFTVRFVGSPAEYGRLAECCPDGAEILKAENLADTIGVISCTDIFVGNDSGLTNIAATFSNCKVFDIFRVTLVERCAPKTANTVVAEDFNHVLAVEKLFSEIKENI